MYPILPYVVGPTLELVGCLCLVLTRSTLHAATLFPSLVPPAIRETLWTFITFAIRLGPFRPHGSVVVDGAQLLRDATDILCNPTLLIIADYRGTQHMARLPDMLCLAPTTLDRIGFLAGLVSALLETPSLGDLALTVFSSLCFALTLDYIVFSAIRHWVKLYFGIYALEEQLYEKVAIERALAQQAADAALALKTAKDRLAEVERDVSRSRKLTRKLDDAKVRDYPLLLHVADLRLASQSKLRAAQDLERSKQREAEDSKRQVEVWHSRAIEVVENAKVGLAEVAAQVGHAREHRRTARASVDDQLASVAQAIDTTKVTTAALRTDRAALVRSYRCAADQPFAHRRLDQSAVVALLFDAFDKHKNDVDVQSAQAAHLTQLDVELADAAQQYSTLR